MSASRRTVLQTITAAALASPLAAQHEHAADVAPPKKPAAYKPVFFELPQLDTVRTLVDLIIPRTDTPGAADAGVHIIIDKDVKQNQGIQSAWKDGLAWLESEAVRSGGKPFSKLAQSEQIAILRSASERSDTPGARFFTLVKSSTIDAYYSTREGLMLELGWNANTYLPDFKGCTHKEHQS